ncbi:hypothetical protein CLCR_08213 [Cladophialophora carrionii]|uniref:Clr5 domain-containing protein n=1 Tax=Cladophialophora carrionii TaxID=86049 RepID=A0A1C1CQU7_9EURO|nr:hypothetical protein CLCR_08213 [Cladophialophora carrionii]
MARPRSQPRPVFKRVQSKQNRNLAFGPYQTLIERFYIHEGRPLKWIMEHMKKEHEFNLSVKQYKSQLKNWGLRHKLTQRDAAFILRLLNQARTDGQQEVVIFSGQPRRREDIVKYIQRNEKLVDEDHLLSCISDDEETPHYIRLHTLEVESAPTTTPPQLPLTPPSASPSGSVPSQVAYRQVSPMRVPIPSPEYTPRNSGEWVNSLAEPAPSSGGTYRSDGLPAHFSHAYAQTHSAARNQPAMPNIMGPFRPKQAAVPAEWCHSWDDNDLSRQWPADFTHAALSVTPAVVEQLGDLDLDIYRFGDHTHSPQLNDGTLTAYFVMYSLYWLICAGQDSAIFQEKGDYYLNSALFSFLCMLTNAYSPAEDCLGALSIVTVLFDCYGQWRRLSDLLKRCDDLTKKHFGLDNPLTMTIAFMRNMLAGPGCPRHDISRLAQIVVDMKVCFPESPKPALTARYNLAWAMLENELKQQVWAPGNFEPARRELAELTRECARHFGDDRIETIMAAATLARATFYCGDAEEAEKIIVQSVLPRVRRNFVDSHPYVWEAKHRHAFFLFRLAEKETGLSKSVHLQLGEQVLREVVPERYRVLGEKNPKSEHSLQLLRDILKAQGKMYEAETLPEWCERELSQYGVP